MMPEGIFAPPTPIGLMKNINRMIATDQNSYFLLEINIMLNLQYRSLHTTAAFFLSFHYTLNSVLRRYED